jgi:formylglycine-generating enzyme required for sulfatase activity
MCGIPNVQRRFSTAARPAQLLFALLLSAWAAAAAADGLSIGPVTVAARDGKTATLSFDIHWDHSWRGGTMHDAAWVFFKFRNAPSAPWRPLRLVADKVVNPTGSGQAAGGTPLEFVVPGGEDGFVGVFLRRARDGVGNVSAKRVTVVTEAVEPLATTSVRGFGLEMVHVPEGPFDVGVVAGPELNRFYAWEKTDTTDTPPFTVTGPGPIPTGRQPGRLWATGLTPEDGGEIPAPFPNGYRGFYAMKFAITQGQYADFLATLTEEEAASRYYPEGHGKWIGRSGDPPNRVYTALGGFPNTWFRPQAPDRDHRCPWLSWKDSAAFAAWAGLRPMTELEYEKACRGPALPALVDAKSFWGLEDCNVGQMYERPVSAATAEGRAFRGTHGRGTTALPADWPQDARGVILRGDVLHTRRNTTAPHQRISGRLLPVDSQADRKPHPLAIWRGVRTDPAGDEALRPVVGRFDPAVPWILPRRNAPAVIDGRFDDWKDPLLVLGEFRDIFPLIDKWAGRRYPSPRLPDSWAGPADLGARVHLARTADDLCIAVEVTDDRHFNGHSGAAVAAGDAVQIGIATKDGLRSLGIAFADGSPRVHQWQPDDSRVLEVLDCAVVRDEAKGATRYELRLPFSALGLTADDRFGFNILVFDDDDGTGSKDWIQLAPGLVQAGGGDGKKFLQFGPRP